MNGRRMRTNSGVTSVHQAEFREPASGPRPKPERPIVGLPGLRGFAARRTASRLELALESAGRIALVVLGLLAAVGGARGQELGPAPLTVNVISRSDTGYGDNTLVWTVAIVPTTAPAADRPYVVTIDNVIVSGSPRTYTYTVTVIDPAVPSLEARFALDQVTIAWPAGPTGFLLQTGAVSGASVTWGNAGLSSTPVANEHRVTFPPSAGARLFRMRK
jgi:hypothetical protein